MSNTIDNRISTSADYPLDTAATTEPAAPVDPAAPVGPTTVEKPKRPDPLSAFNPKGRTAKFDIKVDMNALEPGAEEGTTQILSGTIKGEGEMLVPVKDLEKLGQKSGFLLKANVAAPFGFNDGYLNADSQQSVGMEFGGRINIGEVWFGYKGAQKYDPAKGAWGELSESFSTRVQARYFDPKRKLDVKYPTLYGSVGFEGPNVGFDYNKFILGAGGNVFLKDDRKMDRALLTGAVSFSQQRKDQPTFFGEHFFDFDYTFSPELQQEQGYVWYNTGSVDATSFILLGKHGAQFETHDGKRVLIRPGYRYGLEAHVKVDGEWDLDSRPDPQSVDPANDDLTRDYTIGQTSPNKTNITVEGKWHFLGRTDEKVKVANPAKPGEQMEVPSTRKDRNNNDVPVQHRQTIQEARDDGSTVYIAAGYTSKAESYASEWLLGMDDTSGFNTRTSVDKSTQALTLGVGGSVMAGKITVGKDLFSVNIEPEVGFLVPLGETEEQVRPLFKVTVTTKKSIPIKLGQ